MAHRQMTRLEAVAKMSLQVARRCVSSYGCVTSRKDFTQPQLIACLVLRAVSKNDYRGVCELLTLSPTLRRALGLEKVPHWTTLQKFMAKSHVPQIIDAMIGQVIAEVGWTDRPTPVAVDSTGLQNGLASLHYQTRRFGGVKTARKSVKVSVAVLCGVLLPAALVVDLGASPDMKQMPALMAQIEATSTPSWLLADAGYDAEWVHERCREQWNAESAIRAIPRTRDGTIKTRWRALMRELPAVYGLRWHAESFFSGMKRTTLATLSSRTERTLLTEAAMKVLAYAIRR